MQIITRDQWGAADPKGPLDAWPDGQPTSWTLHYEGVDVDVNEGDYTPRVQSIQAYHQSHGYFDIAYSFVVSPSGQAFSARGWDYRSAAQVSGNPVSLAICYIGGPSTPLTDAAKAAINQLIAQRPMEVFPHQHWFATACPGEQVLAWLEAGRPDSGGIPPAPPIPPQDKPDARPMLRFGARGSAVVEMQNRLRAHGFDPGASDGIYGPATGGALKAFQGSQGIAADGICGPITWSRLDQQAAGAPARLLAYGSVGADVAQLQDALRAHGNDPGASDGIFGPRTDAAVRAFQASHGCAVDGIVGPQTRGALGI